MDLAKYRRLFLDESREHLQELNEGLLRLEQEGAAFDGVDALFRAAHSIKGMSGSMGYDAMVAVAHALEDLLDRLRRKSVAVTPGLVSLFYEGVDALGSLATEVEETGAATPRFEDLVARFRDAAAAPAAAPAPEPAAVPESEAEPEPVPDVEPVPEPEAEPEVEPERGPEGEAAPVTEADPEPEPTLESEVEAEPMPDAAPAPAAGPETESDEDRETELELELELPSTPVAAAAPAPLEEPPPPPTAAVPAPAERLAPPPPPAEEPPAADLVAARGGIFTLEPEKLAMVRDFVRSGLVPYACTLRVAKDSAALGARNFIILGKLTKAGMLLASSPTIEEVRGGAGRAVVEALLLTERPEEQLRAQLLTIPELEEMQVRRLRIGTVEPPPPQPGAPAPPPQPAGFLAPRVAPVERPAGGGAALADRYAPRKAATVRVDTRVLDDLINIVGELIITRERLAEIGRELGSEELQTNLGRLHTLVREFQDSIMTVRMMPLDLVTDRLPRIVRDLAHRGGKEIGFEVLGRGIELDRAILEELGDVLVHLVRNAIDHGVETPAERAAAGKGPKASVRVRAGRDRDWVWIRVEDDGRGMDPERIARAAVARGLVSAEKAAELDAKEKLLLSCLPGVSTADQVTDVSGRGVGMDVVKAKVDSFGGALQIDSQPGRSTAITLRLPLTLAIIRILLVEVRGQEFGLPVSHVVHTAQLEPAGVEWSQRRPLLRWGGRLVPLVDMAGVLGLPARDLRAQTDLFLTVAEFGDRAAAFAVDRLLGTYEVVIKPLGPPLKRVRGLSGVTVMGDGRTVLLLDPAALVQAP